MQKRSLNIDSPPAPKWNRTCLLLSDDVLRAVNAVMIDAQRSGDDVRTISGMVEQILRDDARVTAKAKALKIRFPDRPKAGRKPRGDQ